MAKKTKVTQRSREEQWRRRVEQQSRQAAAPAARGRAAAVEDDADVEDEATGYEQAEIRPMPSGVTTTARATATTAPRTPRATPTSPAAARRTPATRASRLAFQQTMSLDEEMHYVRSDIRQLVILTALCLAVLIALSFVIR
ncbi:MAG TPA: hypothetical protein VFR15_10060 [Chloroflexia bacterium]|nr:hypothetical protein [Chloroflexia bacterium]